jgi:hypothetical protein
VTPARVALRHLLRRGGWRSLRVVVRGRPVEAPAVGRAVWAALGPIRFGEAGGVWDALLAEAEGRGADGVGEGEAWTLALRYLARDRGLRAAEAAGAAAELADPDAAARGLEAAAAVAESVVRAVERGALGAQACAVSAWYLAALSRGPRDEDAPLLRIAALAARVRAAAGPLAAREARLRRLAAALGPLASLRVLRDRATRTSPMARDEEQKLVIGDWAALVAPRLGALEEAHRALAGIVG